MNLLLLSNSSTHGKEYFSFAKSLVSNYLTNKSVSKVLFIPYAYTGSNDEYLEMIQKALPDIEVEGIHQFEDKIEAIKKSEAILVGGGNTFNLIKQIQEQNLTIAIKERVNDGTPYIGWSAGSNIAGPSIKTTNDMPIVEPPSFDALDLISFQINPHYTEKTIVGHNGESRKQRLKEFLSLNPESKIMAVPEGCYVEVMGEEIIYKGIEAGKLLSKDHEEIIQDGKNIESLV